LDNYDDECGYTYFHDFLGHYSWLDHLFVSSSVAAEVTDFQILDLGCNNSDHHPITWSLQNSILSINVDHGHQTSKRVCKQCWDKADLMLYYSSTGTYLQMIDMSKHLMYDNINHQIKIEKFYTDTVHALTEASKVG